MRYEEYAKGLWFDKESNRRLTSEACEVLNDVKEAVKRLLGEIDNLMKDVEREIMKREREGDYAYAEYIAINHGVLLITKNLVKKHLAWVVGEDENCKG